MCKINPGGYCCIVRNGYSNISEASWFIVRIAVVGFKYPPIDRSSDRFSNVLDYYLSLFLFFFSLSICLCTLRWPFFHKQRNATTGCMNFKRPLMPRQAYISSLLLLDEFFKLLFQVNRNFLFFPSQQFITLHFSKKFSTL